MDQISIHSLRRAQQRCQEALSPMVFSGAGLSVESGISAFRTANGLWNQVDVEKYATPQGFAANPEAVRDWYWERRIALPQVDPNAGHHALARRGWRHATQNVDDLLERAGSKDVLHLHGTLLMERCHENCGFEMKVNIPEKRPPKRCPECGAPTRPSVVWFNEPLETQVFEQAGEWASESDLLLVVGTRAEVTPAADLILIAKSNNATVIVVNPGEHLAGQQTDIMLPGPAGEVLPMILGEEEIQDAQK